MLADFRARKHVGTCSTLADFIGVVMPVCYADRVINCLCEGNGEGGIRTLGTLLGYGALAKRCFRPLSHLTKISLRRQYCSIEQRLLHLPERSREYGG